jgi:hypothetical protein
MVEQYKSFLYQDIFRVISRLRGRLKESFKVHDYTHQKPGIDYVFEAADIPNQSYMTGQGKGINVGDRLLLQQEGEIRTYLVKKVDYYADPSNIWIALLEAKQD